jgi:DNA-binding SARP family transcriptional activator/energy-coupling factor transporter ATP-binding protein EcfA2
MIKDLWLNLLGSPEILYGGQPLEDVLPKKAQALLYYLSLTRGIHARNFLASMLWSTADTTKAQTNMRNILPPLRQHLDGVFTIEYQTITFNVETPYVIDVERFERILKGDLQNVALPSIEDALSLYRGEFLAEFRVRNAPVFEQWLIARRENFFKLALKGWETVARRYLAQEEFEQGIAAATKLLMLQSYHEGGHRLMMQLLAKIGERKKALAQYKLCEAALRNEIDVAVSAETIALYRQIKNAPAATLPMTRTPIKQPDDLLPCHCCEQALQLLDGLLTDAVAGQGQVLFIKGMAGSGKSRLLQTFAQQAPQTYRSVRVATVSCSKFAVEGYAPFETLFEQLGLVWPTTQVVENALVMLHTAARRRPLLLIVDDLHQADTSSLQLFEALADSLTDQPILLIAAQHTDWLKDGERIAALSYQSNTMLDLDDLWLERGECFVNVLLDREPHALPAQFRRQLFTFTRGHPYIVANVWRSLQSQGGVERDSDGVWRQLHPIVWEDHITEPTKQLIESWLVNVPEMLRFLLRVAAVEGVEFTAAAVGMACSAEPHLVAYQLGQLERRFRLIREDAPLRMNHLTYARYRFQHPLVRQHLYMTLSQHERNTFQQGLGEAFVQLYN